MNYLLVVVGLMLGHAIAWDEPNVAFFEDYIFADLAAEGCLGVPLDDRCALALTQTNAEITLGAKRQHTARRIYQKTTAPKNDVEPNDDMRRESSRTRK